MLAILDGLGALGSRNEGLLGRMRAKVSGLRTAGSYEVTMSDCIHCDILDLLDPVVQSGELTLQDTAAKVTEVLADLILLAPPEQRGTLLADVLANLGEFVLQKGSEEPPPEGARRH